MEMASFEIAPFLMRPLFLNPIEHFTAKELLAQGLDPYGN
jgi:hypothetical protein